jgi:hypothetical protein
MPAGRITIVVLIVAQDLLRPRIGRAFDSGTGSNCASVFFATFAVFFATFAVFFATFAVKALNRKLRQECRQGRKRTTRTTARSFP